MSYWRYPQVSSVGLAALLVAFAGATVGDRSPKPPSPRVTTAQASDYNRPHQGRTSDCGALRDPTALIPLRYADGTPTGYYVSGRYPVTRRQANSREGRALDRGGCAPGTTEVDAREVVDSPSGKMLFHPGGGSYPYPGGADRWGHYGHIRLSDFSQPPPAPDPYEGRPVGNGRPRPTGKRGNPDDGEYEIQPVTLDADMWYKPPHGKPTGARYRNYGDWGDGGMFLVWNWVQNGSPSPDERKNHLPGGGYVRAVLKRGMIFRRGDVPPLKTVSYGLDDAQNGWVTVVYGKVFTGRQWLYGWTIHSYEKWTRRPSGRLDKRRVQVLRPMS